MCNLNILCKQSDGSCKCTSHEQPFVKPIPIPLVTPQEGALVLSLFRLIGQQKEMIRKITEDSKLTNSKILKVSQKLGLKSNQIECTSEESTNPEQLLKLLTGRTDFLYTLQVVSEVPSPAFKEKPFSMLLQVVDCDEKRVSLPANTQFNVNLFTTENPPKILKTSMAGDKVMRGTIEVEGSGSVFFKKIVIKEVSSHFLGGCFYLVVSSKNQEIKPMIVENFVVKARKVNDGTIRKKMKVEMGEVGVEIKDS